jgi:transcriptional regulator with XRE-family HTH domain
MPGRKRGKSEPNPIDVRVGHRIKVRRRELGLSQSALADSLGVTFQQVQKYEKGRNRIGAGRLTQIARFLKVSPSVFFERAAMANDEVLRDIDDFVASKEGMDLMRAMAKVENEKVRHHIAILVEEVVNAYYDAK